MEVHIRAFLAHLADRNRSPITLARYGEILQRLRAFAAREVRGDAVPAGAPNRAIVRAFVHEAATPGLRLAPATRNQRLATCKSFYRWALVEGLVERDPTVGVDFAREPRRDPTFLTAEEVDRLLQVAESTATEHYLRRDLALLTLLFHTGLRLAEVLSIDVGQVQLAEERVVRVRRKGGDAIDVLLNDVALVALRRWIWERQRYPRAADEPALFLSDRGNRLSRRALERLVERYARRAVPGKRVTVHTLRHSTATELVRRGVGIETVARVLNHRSLAVTQRYVHLVGAQVQAAVAVLAQPADARRPVPPGHRA